MLHGFLPVKSSAATRHNWNTSLVGGGVGPGYAQQRVVIDEVARQQFNGDRFIAPMDINLQQEILTCWHDLFREGRLSWGYDLDNPDAPFFHIPNRNTQIMEPAS